MTAAPTAAKPMPPANPLTPRDDKTIDFSDQDQTYKATLYKCPE